MKKILLTIIAAIIVLGVIVTRNESNTIIIYTSLEQFRNDAIQRQLNTAFPELNIAMMYLPTAKVAAKVQHEGEKSDADIILGLETSYMEIIKQSLADVSSFSHVEYEDNLLTSDGTYLIWERYGGGFAVNTKVLEKNGLPEPDSYEDLLDPKFKDLISMPDPNSSGTGFNFYLNLVNERGQEGALAYFDELAKNVKQFPASGSGPVKLLVQGEIAVGFALSYQVIDEANKGNPLKMIYPKEGSPYSLSGLGMIKGRNQNEDIVRVFTYIANQGLVHDKEHFSPEKILKKQQNKVKNYPKNIHYANMKGIDDLLLKEELLKKWKY